MSYFESEHPTPTTPDTSGQELEAVSQPNVLDAILLDDEEHENTATFDGYEGPSGPDSFTDITDMSDLAPRHETKQDSLPTDLLHTIGQIALSGLIRR